MDFDFLNAKTAASLDEIRIRAVEPRGVWEASEIVADIQDAYDLALAA
jgi:hypothetical protein